MHLRESDRLFPLSAECVRRRVIGTPLPNVNAEIFESLISVRRIDQVGYVHC